MDSLSPVLDLDLAEQSKYLELSLISEAIQLRLLDPKPGVFTSSELPDLFTQWWQAVVILDTFTWEDKEYAAKALAAFRSSYGPMPLMTARWLRYQTKHLLKRAQRSLPGGKHVSDALDSQLLNELDCPCLDFTAWSPVTQSELAITV